MQNKDKVLICEICGADYSRKDIMFLDKCKKGFWCDECDVFNYYDAIPKSRRHRFELNIECSGSVTKCPTTAVKLKKRLSPLRYPGGKSRIVDGVFTGLNPQKCKLFVEPYAGGAGVGLSLLESGTVEKLQINDVDYGVYSLFEMILSNPISIISFITNTRPTHQAFFDAQSRILNDYAVCSQEQAAWDLLLVNRLAYSGIMKAYPLGGKDGSSATLLSRWNPTDLISRIMAINEMKDRITVTNVNAIDLIEEVYWNESATMFIDPPYVDKGPRLYTHSFTEDDHIELCVLLESLYSTCPGADIQLYYDNHDLIFQLYSLPEFIELHRRYSA